MRAQQRARHLAAGRRACRLAQRLLFVADVSGTLTGDEPGPVRVEATASSVGAGFRLSRVAESVIDGFHIMGGVDGGRGRIP